MKESSSISNVSSDAELILLYKQNGDLEILAQLYQRYTSLVFGVCLKYLVNKEDAKDAVMNIFEKLIESLQKHDVQNFKSWLHVTSRNHCLMELRKLKSNQINGTYQKNGIDHMEIGLSMHHKDEDPIVNDLQLMNDCIEKLPINQKTCIQLFFLEEKSYKEVSVNSGYEINKVKSYIQNGRRNLKNCIERQREKA
jgi:RNA polymerase sigma-70 factor (ECF subfamily)